MKRDLKILQGIHTTSCSFVIKHSFRTHSSATKCVMLWETGRSHPELQPKQQQRLHGWVLKHGLLHFAHTYWWSSKTAISRKAWQHANMQHMQDMSHNLVCEHWQLVGKKISWRNLTTRANTCSLWWLENHSLWNRLVISVQFLMDEWMSILP